MITFSKFKSAVFSAGKRIVKVQQFGIKTAATASAFGDDSQPLENTTALFAKTSNNAEPVVIGYINKNQLAGPGEKRIFSVNSDGIVQAYIWLKKDGNIEFSGDDDNLVRYSELKTAFNELKADHNGLAAKWDAFAAAYLPGGPASVGLPSTLSTETVGQSGADISGAKIDKFKSI